MNSSATTCELRAAAVTGMNNDVWEIEDTREDYGEERIITFGLLKGRVVILIYTLGANVVRVISLRKADSDEEQLYFENVFDGLGTD